VGGGVGLVVGVHVLFKVLPLINEIIIEIIDKNQLVCQLNCRER